MDEIQVKKTRWRLTLGEGSEQMFGPLEGTWQGRDALLGFLYGREYGRSRNVRGGERTADLSNSVLTVPEWINQVHTLFPRKTIERLEKDALERYEIQEMVTNPEVLERATPNEVLLKAVLHTKHLMNQEVLKMARQLVQKVVDELMKKLARPVQAPFLGALNRQRRSYLKIAKNLDTKSTIRRNLKHYDHKAKRLFIQEPIFYSRIRQLADRWKIIIVVDQSGSMTDSVIHSAVTASIFWGIRTLKTHLILFDTNIVDVTEYCSDPVETLMKVQLGGGTDIGQAVAYASNLVENARKTIIVLVTDFYEGASPHRLLSTTQHLVQSGVLLLGLAALDERAEPNYDRNLARQLANLGAHIGAMTPGELAAWVSEKVR